jgi:uncharacterized protein (DUF983 family)
VAAEYPPLPIWAHLLLWLPLTATLGVAVMRPLEGLTIAHSYVRGAEESRH